MGRRGRGKGTKLFYLKRRVFGSARGIIGVLRLGKEEDKKKGAVIYLDLFPEALEMKTGSENHWRAFSPPSFRQQRSHP